MNKFTLLLQDKDIIAEIAKDPEVQIKIKDAIIDGAIRRTAKLTNGISDQIADTIKKEMVDFSGWRNKLKPEYVELIKSETKNFISNFVDSEAKLLNEEVKNKFEQYRMFIIGKLEELDIDKVIREEIRKAVNEKFK